MVRNGLLRRAAFGPNVAGMERTRTTPAILIALGLLLGVTSACSSDGSPSADGTPTSKPDRGAQENRVAGDWDVEFNVLINNSTLKPMEVGVSLDPHNVPNGEQNVVSATPGIQPQAAGNGTVFVVPPSPDGGETASQLNLYVQEKIGTSMVRENRAQRPDVEGPQDLLIVLPTAQLRFRVDYSWKSENCGHNPYGTSPCDYRRIGTMNIQTRDATGFQIPISTLQARQCFDPMNMPNFKAEVGGLDQAWNAKPVADLDTVTVDYRSATTMTPIAAKCTEAKYPAVRLPGISLAPATKPVEDTKRFNLSGRNLPGAEMPGIDLTYANLDSTDFTGAGRSNLAYARLAHANLVNTIFTGANLAGADLTDADVTDASFRNTILYDVDLTAAKLKDNRILPWANVSGAHLCRTKLPAATIADYVATIPDADPDGPDLNGSCGESIASMMGRLGANAVLVDTNSSVPLTLVRQYGSFDCAMASSAGSFGLLPWPATACWGTYGSSRLIEKGIPDDDVARTTTTLKGQTPPRNALRNGSFILDARGANTPLNGLSLNTEALPEGWKGLVCLFVQRDPETNACLDQHRALQPSA